MLASNVDRVATFAGEYVSEHGNKYRSTMPERQDPAVNVNPALRHGVYYLYRGSKGVAKVTRYLCKFLPRNKLISIVNYAHF